MCAETGSATRVSEEIHLQTAVKCENAVQGTKDGKEAVLSPADKAAIRRFALEVVPNLDAASTDHVARGKAADRVIDAKMHLSLMAHLNTTVHVIRAVIKETLLWHHNEKMRQPRSKELVA